MSDKLTSSRANRHAWALERHGHLLVDALRKDTSADAHEVEKRPEEQIPARLVSLILGKADPTQNKGMTAWLVRQYAEGNLRLEDLGTANETLTMFRRYMSRLTPGQRDLGQYPSLAAVWEAVIGFANAEEQHLSGKAQKALDRDKAYAESRILRQDLDGFTIAVPLTEFAARWWGRGTRWCTAAENRNAFWHYYKDAPLIVVVIPELKEKGKFQLWATEGVVQFMDAADNSVSDVLITEYWPRFEPLIGFALRKHGWALEYVPQTLRTDEICRIVVAQYGMALMCVPKALRTGEMCRIAVAEDGRALCHVPEAMRTDELCRIAVAQEGWALEDVPVELRTEVMCRIAVGQNGGALAYVPPQLRTDELCRIAVAQSGWALRYVPEGLLTNEMCRIAMTQHGWALRDVPEKLRTDEMCRIAVAQDGGALEYVPPKLRTEEMCKIAVVQNGVALYYVPEQLRTDELCRLAVAQNGLALLYVPQVLRAEAMCKIAIKQNGKALEWVPENRITFALCKIAIQNTEEARPFIPFRFREKIDRLHPPKPLLPTWDLKILDEMEHGLVPRVIHSVDLRHE